jgi:hypothetical protein
MTWPEAEQPERMSLAELQAYADGLAAAGDLVEATRLRRELAILQVIAESLRSHKSRGADAKEIG